MSELKEGGQAMIRDQLDFDRLEERLESAFECRKNNYQTYLGTKTYCTLINDCVYKDICRGEAVCKMREKII